MNRWQWLGIAFLALVVAAAPAVLLPAASAQTNTARAALERGYRTGYSDAYQEGYKDYYDAQTSEFCAKTDFLDATRAYETKHGPRESYRDGYKQGYAKGYQAGYARTRFDPAIPTDLRAGGSARLCGNGPPPTPPPPTPGPTGQPGSDIPANTVIKVELLNGIATDTSRRDDGFRMRVLEPREYEGATIEGHISRLKRPGRVAGKAELQLVFDRIRMANQRVANFDAQIIEITNFSETNIGKLDQETGGFKGKDSYKKDGTIIGGATGAGAVIGIAGGPVGVAIGAGVGAGVGTAIVLTTRGKEIRIPRGQQFRIVTTGSTRFVATATEDESGQQ